MRETLSAYKEQIRKQTLQKDKLCVITKSPQGKIIDVNIVEWVDTPIIEELIAQANINKQEYLAHETQVQQDKEDTIKAEFALLQHNIDLLAKEIEKLQHELMLIKGEE
jgi:hypothetical protein